MYKYVGTSFNGLEWAYIAPFYKGVGDVQYCERNRAKSLMMVTMKKSNKKFDRTGGGSF